MRPDETINERDWWNKSCTSFSTRDVFTIVVLVDVNTLLKLKYRDMFYKLMEIRMEIDFGKQEYWFMSC